MATTDENMEQVLSDETNSDFESVNTNTGLTAIKQIEERSYAIIERLRTQVFAPDSTKTLNLRFTAADAGKMVGRTPQHIRLSEKNGKLPSPDTDDFGRRNYTLDQVNHMRDVFGTLPYRAETDEPIIMAVSSFKGGVGKSTITTHIAQDFALKGYRVGVIDCDPQGSTTLMFGLNPDYDLDRLDTIYPFLSGEVSDNNLDEYNTLHYALRQTYWPNIQLIPANLFLYNAEYELAAQAREDAQHLYRLKEGIDSIKDQFDIILIDPPPALGMISLSVLNCANALLIPVPPSNVDFSSTAHFFTMLSDTLSLLEERGMSADYKFVKVLVSRKDERKQSQKDISEMMRIVYGADMLNAQMKDSAEVDNAATNFMTVLEQSAPTGSRGTYKRARAFIQAVGNEIELEVRKTWPSHHEALKNDGLI